LFRGKRDIPTSLAHWIICDAKLTGSLTIPLLKDRKIGSGVWSA